MPRILRRDIVKQDILELAAHIARDKKSAAIKFLEAVEDAFQLLASLPTIGTLCEFRSPIHEGMRVWTIRRLKRYLILYRPIDDGIEVIRVLHGRRDLEALFEHI